MPSSQIGLIGLAVMGANLARNIAEKKFSITVFNRTKEKTAEFIKNFGNQFLKGETELSRFVESLEKPRKIIIMVKAGNPVDEVISEVVPLLAAGDIIIDCGNSFYRDTNRRYTDLNLKKIHFIGCGVSGGEEGALYGPSLMPGGAIKVYHELKPIFEAIAAKDFNGLPCVTYCGEDGAGHYIKMTHNGIEYSIMQMMAEAYDILRKLHNLSAPEIADIFESYNRGLKLKSFLFEISLKVLRQRDELSHGYLIDHILDKAEQKGTGKWTAIDALERGVYLSSITEAVFARIISFDHLRRHQIASLYKNLRTSPKSPISIEECIKSLEGALYLGLISSYAQGFDLIHKAAQAQSWNIDTAEISRIWQGGCIIRATLLQKLHSTFKNIVIGKHLLETGEIIKDIQTYLEDYRKIVSLAVLSGIPVPGLAAGLCYIESFSESHLPTNFIQGLRDYFGAHTYERIDREGVFHTNWNQNS
ncbi:NADP-dependent phosphogluconate dehydrogenase [Candidatus Peregrinibacteria bacterium]|nr:NADP-dependent phosphogluconate dehydrogenase [Candidatus Peregrinibacteria bacterium]